VAFDLDTRQDPNLKFVHLFKKVRGMSSKPNQTIKPPAFDVLPDSAFIRESQLVYNPKRPEFPALLPFSAATLWRKVAAGTFPRPIKLSTRVTAWRVAEVRRFLQSPAGDVV
jgi:predicted DNA-binding transcriptional regulator AlpA